MVGVFTVLKNQLRGRCGRAWSCLFAPLTLLEIWTKHLCRKRYGHLLSREGFNFRVVHLERCFWVWCIGEKIQIIPGMPSSGSRNWRVPWSNGEQRQMVQRMLSSYPFDSHYQASNNVIVVMGQGIDLFCNQIISDCKTELLTASNGFISAPHTPPPSPPNTGSLASLDNEFQMYLLDSGCLMRCCSFIITSQNDTRPIFWPEWTTTHHAGWMVHGHRKHLSIVFLSYI